MEAPPNHVMLSVGILWEDKVTKEVFDVTRPPARFQALSTFFEANRKAIKELEEKGYNAIFLLRPYAVLKNKYAGPPPT